MRPFKVCWRETCNQNPRPLSPLGYLKAPRGGALPSALQFTWLCAFGMLGLTAPLAKSATLVQEFYLPMPEAQVYQAESTIQSGISTTQNSIYSIVVTGNGTQIYYDQWEDGYEVNLNSPTQAT